MINDHQLLTLTIATFHLSDFDVSRESDFSEWLHFVDTGNALRDDVAPCIANVLQVCITAFRHHRKSISDTFLLHTILSCTVFLFFKPEC
jgi:hypothetical protein